METDRQTDIYLDRLIDYYFCSLFIVFDSVGGTNFTLSH